MLNLRKVAITGGIASGKTTACRFFQKLGAFVVSADAIVHELLNPQTHLGQKVIQTLGSEILRNGKIDRTVVADKVFKDQVLLRKLEHILHPAVEEEIERQYKRASLENNWGLFVVEVPLLFEIGKEGWYDVVIAVVADESIARKRFIASGHKSEEYERRMHRQLSQKIKQGKAHYTLTNNGDVPELQHQVEKLYAQITKKS